MCTTIRPTQLPYKELYDWDGAAEFVADYLNFVTLEPAHELVCTSETLLEILSVYYFGGWWHFQEVSLCLFHFVVVIFLSFVWLLQTLLFQDMSSNNFKHTWIADWWLIA